MLFVMPLDGKVSPMCVATAMFLNGPIRQHIDVSSIGSCMVRNTKNDCKDYTRFSLKGRRVRSWLNRRLKNGKIKAVGIKEYSIETEAQEIRRIVKEESERLKRQRTRAKGTVSKVKATKRRSKAV